MKKSYSHVEALIFRWNVVYCNVGSDLFLVEIHFSSSAARTSYRVCNRLLCCFIEFFSVCWFNTLCDVVEPIIEFCKWVCRNLCCFGCFFCNNTSFFRLFGLCNFIKLSFSPIIVLIVKDFESLNCNCIVIDAERFLGRWCVCFIFIHCWMMICWWVRMSRHQRRQLQEHGLK